jgi:hypothetical protein
MYGNRNTRWEGDRLYISTRSTGYSIVRDQAYPTMWRVRSPDGALSDMVNRARAKDAAITRALAVLNVRETGAEQGYAA